MSRDIEIMQALLKATQSQKLVWKRVEPDYFETQMLDGIPISITRQYPMLPDETTSGPDIAQVSVLGLGLTFCSGTEGMDIVLQILGLSFPSWTEWNTHIEASRDVILSRLQSLLE